MADAVEALAEKMLGTAESLLPVVEAKEAHDSLIMPLSGAGCSRGGPATMPLATLGKAFSPVGRT
jgi:hypothetical protein